MLYGTITEFCTEERCPIMSAGITIQHFTIMSAGKTMQHFTIKSAGKTMQHFTIMSACPLSTGSLLYNAPKV